MSSRLRVGAVAVVTATTALSGLVALPDVATASTAASTTASTAASTTAQRPRPASTKVAYLTFDDGPTGTYTPQVLRILRRYNAKATFFMIGNQAAARPDLVRQVRKGGHAIGNHTYNHPTLTRLTDAQVARQLTSTSRILGRTTCMRPPGGATNARVNRIAHRLGQRVVLWNVDTRDWTRPGTSSVLRAATNRPYGSKNPTILFHDGGGNRSQTVAALPGVLESLKRKGFRFETLPACR